MKSTQSLPENTHIGYTHLMVTDLERSLFFYQDILGFRIIEQEGLTVVLSASGEPPAQMILSTMIGVLPRPPHTTGLYHVAIRLPDRQALSRVFRRALEHQIPFHGAADHLVSEALYLPDPDDNGIELYVDRPRQEWPELDGQIAMSTDPLDLQDLLNESENDGKVWDGIAAGTDIGHVHLQVSNLERAEAFYSDLLGLDVTQRGYPGALFLSAGGYHHHLGLKIWTSRNAPPPPPEAVGLIAFKLNLPDENARQILLQRIQDTGQIIEEYSPGSLISGALIKDPDGIQIIL